MNKRQERTTKRVIFWALFGGMIFSASQVVISWALPGHFSQVIGEETAQRVGLVCMTLASVLLMQYGPILMPPFDDFDLQDNPEESGRKDTRS